MRCYWSCLPWIVAWSWWKDNVPSTFLTYCHISPFHRVYRTHPRTLKHTQVTPYCQPMLPMISLRRYLRPGPFPIPTHQCHYRSTCIQPCTCFSSSHLFLLNGLFLMFHSMACAFFCFFCKFGCQFHTEKKRNGPNCGGWRFGGEHNIYQGCRVRTTAGGSSRDNPLHLNIQQCVMLTENS